MSPISIGVLALSMSIDALIASLGRGATKPRPTFRMAVKTGLIFGVIEALTPLIGWAAGIAASQYVAKVDHWIAFALLLLVGLRMISQAWNREGTEDNGRGSLWATITTAIGTSLDAMAVGVSLAFIEVNIFVIAVAIGLTTMVMSSVGILAGRFIGQRFGRVSEAIGGLALIALGSFILFEHLSAA